MSEENLGLPRYFKVQTFCMKRIGLSIINHEIKVTNYFWAFLPITAKILVCFSILHYVFLHISDINEAIDAMAPAWQLVLSILKWFTFMYKRKEVERLVKSIWVWNLEANEVERNIIVRENKKDILFCRIYLTIVTSTGYIALLKPIILGLAVWVQKGHFPLVPVIKASYPLDMQNPFYFYFQLLCLYFMVWSLIYTSVGADSLFSWITHNTIAQFGILHLRYRRIALEHNSKILKQSIIECVQYHRRVIDKVQDLNQVLGVIIFNKFIISCLQICMLAYQLSMVKNLADLAFLSSFLLSIALQLILYCYNGQRLKDESANVSDNIYTAFQWQKVEVSSRKLLLLSMMRARRVCSLTGIFFVVDLSLYLWVFRTAGSYFTMLMSLNDEPNEQ